MQDNIYIGNSIILQTWLEDGNRWYPLTTINREIFGRDKVSMTALKNGGWDKYCKKVKLEYKNEQGITVLNETNVIIEYGFKEYIQSKKIGILNVNQKKNYNLLLEYLKIDKKILEKEKIIKEISNNELLKYSQYAIKINKELNISEYCLCNKCGIYYPVHKIFYPINEKYDCGLNLSTCNKCIVGNFIGESKDVLKSKIKNTENIFEKINIIHKEIKGIPEYFYTKENIVELFNQLKHSGVVTYDNFSREYYNSIIKDYKLIVKKVANVISYMELTIELFDIDFYCRPYKYNRPYASDLHDFNFQKTIFDNYLKDNNISILDRINFNYSKILYEAHIKIGSRYKNGALDYLDFVDKYNNFEYPAYKYKIPSNNYWKIKDNRIRALKDVVTELKLSDLKKLPIYLTKYTLSSISRAMYSVYRKYYDNLFDWVNECYPNMFEFSDFNTNIQRNEFDSLEEKAIHDILKEKFGRDLIYNNGDGSNRFSLCDKYQPDWIVLRSTPIVVEYFGMYSENYTDKSTLVKYYNEKMPKKIEHYETLENYDKLYIYPYDLKNNFEGLYKKLEDYA